MGSSGDTVSIAPETENTPDNSPDNSPNNSPDNSLSELIGGSDLVSVYGSEEYVNMTKEFQASGSFDKMNEIYMIFCVPDDEAEQLLAKQQNEDTRNALRSRLFNAETVSRDYQSEKIILLLYPNEEFINKALKAAGLGDGYVLDKNEAPDGYLEMFAFTKRTTNNRTYRFSYYAACDDVAKMSSGLLGENDPSKLPDSNITVISGDRALTYDNNRNIIGSQDIVVTSTDKEDISGPDDSNNVLFNVERWRNFYNWAAGISDSVKQHEAEASAIEIYLAAEVNDITKLADAQVETLNCPLNISNYSPWNIDGCQVDVKRITSMVLSIYNCHSYRYGHDYYLVKTNRKHNPA